jgi:hypothetical protein
MMDWLFDAYNEFCTFWSGGALGWAFGEVNEVLAVELVAGFFYGIRGAISERGCQFELISSNRKRQRNRGAIGIQETLVLIGAIANVSVIQIIGENGPICSNGIRFFER